MELLGSVSADAPLMEAGLDSVGAVEFRSRLIARLGGVAQIVPETLISDFPTLREIQAYVEKIMSADEEIGEEEDALLQRKSAAPRKGFQANDDFDNPDRLVTIADANAIPPLVALLSSPTATTQARENAAGALMHLALDQSNQIAIARANGIQPLVTVLDDGTPTAHQHAAAALSRLALNNADNQAQIAKHAVALLGNPSAGAQRRAAHCLRDLAAENPDSPVVIVNAGAISPLVNLLSGGAPEVKEEAAGALSTLALNSPSTQLAIATGLVALVGVGSAESQEHVTQLMLTLAHDPNNRVAISKAGAIPRLVTQLRGASTKAQELAAAVLSYLSGDSKGNVDTIASAAGIYPLVTLLTSDSAVAQAHAAAVLADMAHHGTKNRSDIIRAGGIAPLVGLLAKESHIKAKAAAAGVLIGLTGPSNPDTQKAVADAGAIKLLVALLGEEHEAARRKASGAIAAIAAGSTENQDAVEKFKGVAKLVNLLADTFSDEVRAEATMALAKLARDNRKIQDKVTACNGIGPLVELLQGSTAGKAKEEAASALWSLSAKHYENQIAIANAGGIASLVAVLGSGSVRAQEHAAGALASLALENTKNETSIAQLIVELLGSTEKQASAKAARAIARLARSHPSNQASIAKAGGVALLVNLLDAEEGGVVRKGPLAPSDDKAGEEGRNRSRRETREELAASTAAPAPAPPPDEAAKARSRSESPVNIKEDDGKNGGHNKEFLGPAQVQREMASAVWAMANKNADNQKAIARAGGIPPLIALLTGSVEVHRDAAGALWSLAANQQNQITIAEEGGINPLVGLLKTGSRGAQETAAGALFALAEAYDNRVSIASAGGIRPLVDLFDGGSKKATIEEQATIDGAIEQAAGALQTLVVQNVPNQLAVAHDLVDMLKNGSPKAQEHVTTLLKNLAQDPDNRGAIAKAGAVPELVRQLECGSSLAMGMAAGGLALIALKSAEHRATVTQELVKLLGSDNEAVRQRASEALRDMASEDNSTTKKNSTNSAQGGPPLVTLLKDGLKDGRVEAQEYALWSLSSMQDVASKEAIVGAGGVKPLIASLQGGKISAIAQEHAATVLSGLAYTDENAWAIKAAGAIDPLVLLLSTGNSDAKEHAAAALAQLARRAEASREIAEAGAVSAFVQWLADPTLGPPDVAARSLSEIALDNPDTQTQIAEEGAIAPLVEMVGAAAAHTAAMALANSPIDSVQPMAPSGAPMASDPLANAPDSCAPDAASAPSAGGAPDAASAPDSASAPVAASAPMPASAPVAASAPSASRRASTDRASAPDASAPQTPGSRWKAAAAAVGAPSATKGRRMSLTGDALFRGRRTSRDDRTSREGASGSPSRSPSPERAPSAAVQRAMFAKALKMSNVAAGALATLAKDNLVNQIIVADEGGIPGLVALVQPNYGGTHENATKSLWHLASNEDNQTQIAKAGGLAPLVALLTTENVVTQQYTAAALEALARDHTENQIALAKAGAIAPLIALLGCESSETQEHAKGALLYLASHDDGPRNAVVQRLVAVLDVRSAAAQMRSCEALAVLAARSPDNRRAITAANAIAPLVRLLADGRRVRSETPQERAAAVLADLAKHGENKLKIVQAGGVAPLVMMLSSESPEPPTHAAAALWQLAALGTNRPTIAKEGAIPPLVHLIARGNADAQRFATGALWHLASAADNKVAMVNAGVIPPLVKVLASDVAEAREYAAAVVSGLARTQGGNKKAIFAAGGIPPLIKLLSDPSTMTQKHAACALWGLSDGKDGVYDKQIVEHGGVQPFIALLQKDHPETRGFAAACLMCLCNDETAKAAIIEAGGTEPLQLLAHGPAAWLRQQAEKMLDLLGVKLLEPEEIEVLRPPSPKGMGDGMPLPAYQRSSGTGADTNRSAITYRSHRGAPMPSPASSRQPYSTRTKFHFFSFQVNHMTGFLGNA